MGRSYDQLSLDDRCEIARLFANGSSVRQIAAALDRSPSTISRELKRNSGAQVGVPIQLRRPADPRPAMEGVAPGTR